MGSYQVVALDPRPDAAGLGFAAPEAQLTPIWVDLGQADLRRKCLLAGELAVMSRETAIVMAPQAYNVLFARPVLKITVTVIN
jgi:hypothetical protein